MLAGLAVFALIAAVLWIPWATEARVVTAATPVPPPLFGVTPIPLKGGSTACLTTVTFDRHTQIGEIGVATGGKPSPPLVITASAPGYRATTRIAGYAEGHSVRFTIATPSRSVIGKLCIHNAGRTTVQLDGTNEFRTMGRPTLDVDGVAQPVDAKLVFYERTRSSYLSRFGQIFEHAAIFTPPFMPQLVLILLALLALAGIPVAIAFALRAAMQDDDGQRD